MSAVIVERQDRGQGFFAAYIAEDEDSGIQIFEARRGISADNPARNYLGIGADCCLNHEQVAKVRDLLTAWLETGSLFGDEVGGGEPIG